jgi:hypothetical protein
MWHHKWCTLCLLLYLHAVNPLNLRTKKSFEASFDQVHPDAFQAVPLPSPPSTLDSAGAGFNLVSIAREGLSGAFAGSIQVILLMWLRTTMSYQHKYGLSLQQTLRDLYKQGGLRRFYKGIEFAMIQAPVAKFFSGKIGSHRHRRQCVVLLID